MITQINALEQLKRFSKNLKSISYEKIYSLLYNDIRYIPLTLKKIDKKVSIERARPNIGQELFKNINELGCIKDEKTIREKIKNYGRANKKKQAMFYGTLETPAIQKPRFTAIAEISNLFRTPNLNLNCLEEEFFTISRWETQKEINVCEFVFSEYAIKNNSEINLSFQKHLKHLQELNIPEIEINFHINFLKFISEEFAKKVSNPYEYKITAAFSNLILSNPNLSGIIYPSVQTEYYGLNIALKPEVAEELIPKILSTQRLYKKGLKSIITHDLHYCKNIDCNQDIVWSQHSPKEILSMSEIEKYFNEK
jgi:hypothetical protein